MFDRIYIVDYLKFIKLNEITFLRKSKWISFLNCAINPIRELYEDFIDYKNDAIYRVSHNGSITLLQKVMNDKFDNDLRRIYIRNAQQQDALRFYSQLVAREVGFYSIAFGAINGFRSSLDFNPDAADFIVHIPIEYQSADEIELNKFLIKVRAQLDYYKLFAKKYKIEWIN